jgi:hypothetical protein
MSRIGGENMADELDNVIAVMLCDIGATQNEDRNVTDRKLNAMTTTGLFGIRPGNRLKRC